MKIVSYVYIQKRLNDTVAVLGSFGDEVKVGCIGITFNGIGVNGVYTSAPAWFVQSQYLFNVGYGINVATSVALGKGYYTFSWTYDYGTYQVEYLLEYEVSEATALIPLSCYAVKLTWLNQNSGWSTWNFKTVNSTGVEVGDTSVYKQPSYLRGVTSRELTERVEEVSTGNVDYSAAEYLESLRYTTQAYKVTVQPNGLTLYEPILINADAFIRKEAKQKFFDYNIAYSISHEIVTQDG